jgi:hypothetical protein
MDLKFQHVNLARDETSLHAFGVGFNKNTKESYVLSIEEERNMLV